jgi:hypothetical protein
VGAVAVSATLVVASSSIALSPAVALPSGSPPAPSSSKVVTLTCAGVGDLRVVLKAGAKPAPVAALPSGVSLRTAYQATDSRTAATVSGNAVFGARIRISADWNGYSILGPLLARPGFVRAAPTFTDTTRLRLPSATSTCYDRQTVMVSHLHSNNSASRRNQSTTLTNTGCASNPTPAHGSFARCSLPSCPRCSIHAGRHSLRPPRVGMGSLLKLMPVRGGRSVGGGRWA